MVWIGMMEPNSLLLVRINKAISNYEAITSDGLSKTVKTVFSSQHWMAYSSTIKLVANSQPFHYIYLEEKLFTPTRAVSLSAGMVKYGLGLQDMDCSSWTKQQTPYSSYRNNPCRLIISSTIFLKIPKNGFGYSIPRVFTKWRIISISKRIWREDFLKNLQVFVKTVKGIFM